MSPITLLNAVTQSPAAVLVAMAVIVVILAIIGAKFTSRKANDNGLVYEYQKHPKNR